MPSEKGDKATAAKDFLEKGKPTHIDEIDGKIDLEKEIDKVKTSLRQRHGEDFGGQKPPKKSWVDRSSEHKHMRDKDDLNLFF